MMSATYAHIYIYVYLHAQYTFNVHVVVYIVSFLRGGRGGGETDFFLLSGGVEGPGLDRLATAASLATGGF